MENDIEIEMSPLTNTTEEENMQTKANLQDEVLPRKEIHVTILKSTARAKLQRLSLNVVRVIRKSLTPPVIASLAGFGIGFIPPLQKLFFGKNDPPLGVIASGLTVLGDAMVPSMMLILGMDFT